MFHQVCINPNYCDALRFLWWPDNDINREREEYQMIVHPSAWHHPQAAPTLLYSEQQMTISNTLPRRQSTASNAISMSMIASSQCLQTTEPLILLVSFANYSPKEYSFWQNGSLTCKKERANFMKDLLHQLLIEQVQGVRWNVKSCTFSFKIVMKDRSSTRRGLLSMVSFVCDPLGFAAPFTP